MENKVIGFIKKFSYSLTSNLVSLLISSLVILVVPKIIGAEEYGYWQLYLFYSGYIGFFHFGWLDGIYLKYGGKKYKELDKDNLFSQFWILCGLQIIISIIFLISIFLIVNDTKKMIVFYMVTICFVLVLPKTMLIYILQATNRIKEYAVITIIDRIVYFVLIVCLLVFGYNKIELLLYADICGKLIALIYAIYYCKDIVFRNFNLFRLDIKDIYNNINIGIKLMFANVASMLIIGIVRYGIESIWDVATFGKISLSISISNMMMIFISAIGVIMFPMLRRINQNRLPDIYVILRNILVISILGILSLYYPIRYILVEWLPEYKESLNYMALLFPMCLYEGKMSLLINTYLKTLRKEKSMLLINIVTVCFSAITTMIVIVRIKNLDLAVLSILLLLGFRAILAEVILSKTLNINVVRDITLELIMTLVFVVSSWYLKSWKGMILYILFYGIYLLINKKNMYNSLKVVKTIIHN